MNSLKKFIIISAIFGLFSAFADEQLKARKELMEEFKIDEDSTFREKIVSEIKRKSELKEAEKELMHKE